MKQIKNKPWFLLLLVLFFVLHGTVENWGFIYFNEVVNIGVTVLVAVGLFFLITILFIKNKIHAALVVFFISAWILFFGAVFDFVKGIRLLHFMHSYTIFVPFMLCTFVLFIIFIRKRIVLQNKLCFYLNVLLLIYCIYDGATVVVKATGGEKQTAGSPVHIDTSLVRSKPDVYLLLFDEYPGYKSLKDSFAFANDSLYDFFRRKGFTLLPTFSNYNMTYYSMSSMLNMQYINKPFVPLSNTYENDQQRIKEIKNAAVVKCFTGMGYRFVNYSIFDVADQPSVKNNSFVVTQATLLTNKIFFNKILKDIGWHFISGKYEVPFIKNMYMEDDRHNKYVEEKLRQPVVAKPSTPQFLYAHLLIPHPPIFCDSTGRYLPAEQIFDPAISANKAVFLSYLKYANKKMESMVEAITQSDPGAIVIVMSDHGYRDYIIGDKTEPLHFNNICAIRFPNNNYAPMKEQWSNVNLFPYIFNSQFNQKIPYLQDSSIFLRDKRLEE